jgi:hypothetical protein
MPWNIPHFEIEKPFSETGNETPKKLFAAIVTQLPDKYANLR